MKLTKLTLIIIAFQLFCATIAQAAILQVINNDPSYELNVRILSPSEMFATPSWQNWVKLPVNNTYTFNTGINSIAGIQWSVQPFGENIPTQLAWQASLNIPALSPYSKFSILEFSTGKYKTTFGQEGQGKNISQPHQTSKHDWRVGQ